MDIKEVLISDLKLDPKNARKHNPKNLETVKYSLEKYGQQKNIVIDSAGNVVAGNGTVMAAKELGWSKLLANVTDLKGKDLIAYGLVDNRSAELAEWDEDVKTSLLSDLFAAGIDINKIGFDIATEAEEVEEIFGEEDDTIDAIFTVSRSWYEKAVKKSRSAIQKLIKSNEQPDDNDLASFVLFCAMMAKVVRQKKKRYVLAIPLSEPLWKKFQIEPEQMIADFQGFLNEKY